VGNLHLPDDDGGGGLFDNVDDLILIELATIYLV
jgi:hypothetical protein